MIIEALFSSHKTINLTTTFEVFLSSFFKAAKMILTIPYLEYKNNSKVEKWEVREDKKYVSTWVARVI